MRRWEYIVPETPDERTVLTAYCIYPDDGSRYYGEFRNGQPDGMGIRYDEHKQYAEGGIWEMGTLVTSMSEDEYARFAESLR